MADPLVILLSDMVAIPSVNPGMDPASAGEAVLADYVAERCRALGLAVEQPEVAPGRPNVMAHLEVPNATRRLLLNSHLDTVPAGDMPNAFTPRVEDGRLFGRGSTDDKGPLAAMLIAMERLMARRAELRCNVTFAATVDEELEGLGAEAVAASGLKFDGAVVGEGTQLHPVLAHQGSLRVRVPVRGRSAHSSQPELGVNAIVHAAEVVRYLAESYAPQVAARRHPLIGPATTAITLIQGGVALNVIPPECVITVKRRALPAETYESVVSEFEAALDELRRARPDITIDPVEADMWHPGIDTPPEAPIAQAALAAVRQAAPERAEFRGVPWGTDAKAYHHAAGVPCVILGPDEVLEQAHTANESVSLDEVARAARIYEELALRFGEVAE